MEALFKKARPIAYGGCGFLVFVFLIVAMTVNLMIVSVNINFFGTVISSTASYTLFASDFDNASGDCSKLGSMAKAARAFCILSILCVPPTWGLAALDLLGKQSLLGPLAPMFKFVMAGFGGLIVFFMIIAWPIMVALPSNASSCTGSSSVATFSVSAAPFIALVAWLVAIGMTVVPLVAPAPPSSAVPETSPQAVTGVAIVPAATPWLPNASPQYPQSAYQQQPQPQYQAYQPPQPARGQAQPKLDDFL